MSSFAKGFFIPRNPEKYAGKGRITYRSSWEYVVMQFLDNHPYVLKWASEPVKIPYFNPFTHKNTYYHPDFIVVYQDLNGNQNAEMLEVKPRGQILENAGRGYRNQALGVLNEIKWTAARQWCAANGLTFRVLTEDDIFFTGPPKKRKRK